jgi:heavy metal sensor kinase
MWYVGAMVIVLGIYAAGVFMFVQRGVSNALNDRLRGDFAWASEMWEQQPDGTLSWFDAAEVGGDENNPWLQVWNASGQLLFRSAVARRNPLRDTARLASRPGVAEGDITVVTASDQTFRVLTASTTIGQRALVIQVARSEAPMREELRELVIFLALGLPFGVAAAGLGGYALARRALVPIERMTEQARTISAAHLSDRLPVRPADDELGRLAVVFNGTLERLEQSFSEMQQFTAHASHQLRTPLTAMRMVGEVGLRDARDAPAYRGVVTSMLEEVDRLTSLVERLLAMSRATSAQARASVETIDLVDLARDVAGYLSVLADEKNQSISVEHAGVPLCRADRLTLRQALINLVDNAIKYSPAGSAIEVRVAASANGAQIDVCDRGPGIAVEAQAGIFERFYRGSPQPSICGSGLGLSISKWAVEANHGELMWAERPGGGSTFRIELPQTDHFPRMSLSA